MNERFYITIVLLIMLAVINIILNHFEYDQDGNKIFMVIVALATTLVGRWDWKATLLALAVYVQIVENSYKVEHETRIAPVVLDIFVIAFLFIMGMTFCCQREKISTETATKLIFPLTEVDGNYLKTDLDEGELYYICYIEKENGFEAQRIKSSETKVIYDSSADVYIEEEFGDIKYINKHFGNFTWTDENKIAGYTIHLPADRIR